MRQTYADDKLKNSQNRSYFLILLNFIGMEVWHAMHSNKYTQV